MAANMGTLTKLAWRNVLRNWRHSVASSLAIAAGFTAISLFDGFLGDISYQSDDGFSTRGMQADVIIQRKDAQNKLIEDTWAYALTKDEQGFLDSIVLNDKDVVTRVRFLEAKGMISNGRNNAIFIGNSYDIKEGLAVRGDRWAWNVVAGKPLHMASTDQVVAIGKTLGEMLDCKIPFDIKTIIKRTGGYIPEERPFSCDRPRLQLSATTEAAQVNALDLTVAAIMDGGFREADKHWVVLPLTTAQKLLDTDKITAMNVKLRDGANTNAFIDRIKQASAAKGYHFDVMTWRDHAVGAFARSTEQILATFRNIFMGIVIALAVLSVANTMMKSVNERIREIGSLRSFGFYQRDISTMFLAEGLFLALLSCGLGLLQTLLLTLAVNFSGITYRAGMLSTPIFLLIALKPWAWIINTVWLTSLAGLTSWFCARRAAGMVVADALRHV